MKIIKPALFILSFLCIFLSINFHIKGLLLITAAIWISIACLGFYEERKKKSSASFLVYDKNKTLLSYATYIGFLTVNYFYFSKRGTLADESISLVFYISLVASVILSRTGDVYYLFDETGIKTLRKSFDYEKIKELRISASSVNVITNEVANSLVIKTSLLNKEMLDFLKGKVSTIVPI